VVAGWLAVVLGLVTGAMVEGCCGPRCRKCVFHSIDDAERPGWTASFWVGTGVLYCLLDCRHGKARLLQFIGGWGLGAGGMSD